MMKERECMKYAIHGVANLIPFVFAYSKPPEVRWSVYFISDSGLLGLDKMKMSKC